LNRLGVAPASFLRIVPPERKDPLQHGYVILESDRIAAAGTPGSHDCSDGGSSRGRRRDLRQDLRGGRIRPPEEPADPTLAMIRDAVRESHAHANWPRRSCRRRSAPCSTRSRPAPTGCGPHSPEV